LHEWCNESPTVPNWNLVKPLPGEYARVPRWEAKTPWSFTAACRCRLDFDVERSW